MTYFVLGFLFSPDLRDVLLIKKERPDWQAGLLNGIGGHIETKENALQAMQREFFEEAGLWVGEWQEYCTLLNSQFKVYCFMAVKDFYDKYLTITDEEVLFRSCDDLGTKVVPSVRWLVPMAQDYFLTGQGFGGMLVYKD